MIKKEVLTNVFKGVSERKKKKSIRGVLDKEDLAEVYNCSSSKKKVKPKSRGDNEVVDQRVNAVEFKEELVEALLEQPISNSHPIRKTSHHSFLEAVRHANEVNLCERIQTINNNTLKRVSTTDRPIRTLDTKVALAGYEPENSLRRMSTAVRPTQLRTESGLRRRSALDRPVQISSHSLTDVGEDQTTSGKDAPSYEPENSLRRTRKISDQSKPTQRQGRERRNAVVLDNPTHSYLAFKSEENQKIQLSRNSNISDPESTTSPSIDILPATPTTPGTPTASRSSKTPLFTLSIPENEEIRDNPPSTPSPKQVRRISTSLKLNNLTLLAPGNRTPPSSPLIKRSKSKESSLASSPTGARRPNRLSLGNLASSAGKLPSRPSRSSVSSLAAMPSEFFESKSLNKMATKKKQLNLQTDGRHINATRYWSWYVHHASYSWQNFNNDNIYCY